MTRIAASLLSGLTVLALVVPAVAVEPAGPIPATAAGETAATSIRLGGKPFFPVGLYRHPRHPPDRDIFKSLADAGFNVYLMPTSTTREQLDAARANGIRVMIVLGHLLDLSGPPQQVEERKQALAKSVGPGSVAFEHPAVVALEGPDEPLWNTRYPPERAAGLNPEFATWVRPPDQQQRVYELLRGLRDGYDEVRRLCGERYQVFLNFAPRSDEQELRWFTGLPAAGGFAQDGRTTADVFGTDVYPAPADGNNGWIRGRYVPGAPAAGAFAAKLHRAVHPYPTYMVLSGCGIGEWVPELVESGRAARRPTLAEQRFMVYDAIVHGARGIMLWGADYIDDESLYWRHIGQVNRGLRALGPMLAEGEDWPDGRSGLQGVLAIGKLHRGRRYLVAVSYCSGNVACRFAAPGWSGDRAWSLLDGRNVPMVDGVIQDTIEELGVRVYSDDTAILAELGLPAPSDVEKHPMHLLFGLPIEMEPFKDKTPAAIAEALKQAGVDGVVNMPHRRELVDALHAEGIKAYAEVACFAGKAAWEKFPGSRPVTAEGEPFDTEGDYGGVCLNHDAHLSDLMGRVEHLLAEAGWDGLWLDFIRWPGRWEQSDPALTPVCFCDTCLQRFSADRAIRCPSELTTTKQKAQWILANHAAAWTDWKCDRVADVVARIRVMTKRKLGPQALVGIFAVPMRASDFDGAIRSTYGQDWAKLGPHVDVFSPMVYHVYCGRPMPWINEVVAEVARGSGRTLWPIVQSCSVPSELSADGFKQALLAGLEPPSKGVMVYSTPHTLQEGKWDTMVGVYRAGRSP